VRVSVINHMAAGRSSKRHPLARERNQELERYLSRTELARVTGVSTATIDRMVGDGMPSVTWGRRTSRRFSASAAIAWALEREQAA
jgi:predicted DNA-binding transcriptional regulator AlpA